MTFSWQKVLYFTVLWQNCLNSLMHHCNLLSRTHYGSLWLTLALSLAHSRTLGSLRLNLTHSGSLRRSSANQVIAWLTISWTLGHNLSRPGVSRCSAQKHIDNAYITMRSNYQLRWESVKSLNCMICNYGWYTIQGKGDTFMELLGHL